MKGTPKELEKCLLEINYFYEKECMGYLTNGHCLIKVLDHHPMKVLLLSKRVEQS
tara:strand:- start:602 stop:766 length:165 start_codon:yes stop_codon:yes gene_type:complete